MQEHRGCSCDGVLVRVCELLSHHSLRAVWLQWRKQKMTAQSPEGNNGKTERRGEERRGEEGGREGGRDGERKITTCVHE